MLHKALITALATACLGFAGVSQATPAADSETASVKVSIADLNVRSEAGARAALRRFRAAAEDVCGYKQGHTSIARAADQSACVKAAVDGAVVSLGEPMVTALNASPRHKAPIVAASR